MEDYLKSTVRTLSIFGLEQLIKFAQEEIIRKKEEGAPAA